MKRLRFYFTKYQFRVSLRIKDKYLLICGGISWEDWFFLTLEPRKELVLYLPIPQLAKEGDQIRFRIVLRRVVAPISGGGKE